MRRTRAKKPESFRIRSNCSAASRNFVADAYIKGLQDYDIELLWEALKHGANNHLKGILQKEVVSLDFNKKASQNSASIYLLISYMKLPTS